MQFKEKNICKNYVYNGKILSLRKDEVVLPNNQQAIREVVEHSGGSAIYCENDGKILLVKQYRYPYEKEIWEIPAGKVNSGENPEQTAIRELEEEGGVIAERVEKMFDIYPTPAYTNEIIRIYRAIDLKKSKQNLDDDEFLQSKWIEKEQVVKMIYDGEINDSKTIIAVLSSMK